MALRLALGAPILLSSSRGSSQTLVKRFMAKAPSEGVMDGLKPYGHIASKGFSLKGMKSHYAVLPLVVIMGCTVIGVIGFSIYSATSRDAVLFNRSKKPMWERHDLLDPKPLKIRVYNQQYRPMEELNTALKAIEEGPEKAE